MTPGVTESEHVVTLERQRDWHASWNNCARNPVAARMAARENATMQKAAVQNDIITETLLLGTQRHLQETQPHLSVLTRVERAQALVDEMLPQERAHYFGWLARMRGLANPAA